MATLSIRQPVTVAVPREGLEFGQRIKGFVGTLVHALEPYFGETSLDEGKRHFLAVKDKATVDSLSMGFRL